MGPQRSLSTADAARILGMREDRVRALVRSGLCRPTRRGRGYRFGFQDLVVLRAAQGLMAEGVPLARVHRALATLVEDLPSNRPLSGLRIFADGRRVAVRDDGAPWNPETGQTLLDFETDELAARVEKAERPPRAHPGQVEPGELARREFDRALELEELDPEAAGEAYQRALELDPSLADAWVNLGRLAHEAGQLREAARRYHRALEQSPGDPVIHFNLALVLEDTRGPEQAAAHYERALALDPDFADAHYNLAGLYEALGRSADALRHYHAYRKLTRG